jgi:enamine deaminase RidA (YjgF/YER057c/UK114 family)
MNIPRRSFLRDSLLLSAGGCAGWLLSSQREFASRATADDQPAHEARLAALGLELPAPAKPVAVYVTAAITGNLLYTAGHIPLTAEGKPLPGRVGQEFTLEQGRDAAHQVGLSILSTVKNKLGTLDRVARLVKVLGMVNCTPEFTQQPQVINGFSELMIQVFGEDAGKAARSAVGVASLPANVPVEIEAIFEILPV